MAQVVEHKDLFTLNSYYEMSHDTSSHDIDVVFPDYSCFSTKGLHGKDADEEVLYTGFAGWWAAFFK